MMGFLTKALDKNAMDATAMKTPHQFSLLKVLAVCLTFTLQYPVTAQTTESNEQSFKFCMRTCASNSCSGPASVVEKNCARKCSEQKNSVTP